MASFALLPIISGFKFDLPRKTIGFKPVKQGDFSTFFSIGTAYGTMKLNDSAMEIKLLYGELDLRSLILPDKQAKSLVLDGQRVDFTQKDDTLTFAQRQIKDSIIVKF